MLEIVLAEMYTAEYGLCSEPFHLVYVSMCCFYNSSHQIKNDARLSNIASGLSVFSRWKSSCYSLQSDMLRSVREWLIGLFTFFQWTWRLIGLLAICNICGPIHHKNGSLHYDRWWCSTAFLKRHCTVYYFFLKADLKGSLYSSNSPHPLLVLASSCQVLAIFIGRRPSFQHTGIRLAAVSWAVHAQLRLHARECCEQAGKYFYCRRDIACPFFNTKPARSWWTVAEL